MKNEKYILLTKKSNIVCSILFVDKSLWYDFNLSEIALDSHDDIFYFG